MVNLDQLTLAKIIMKINELPFLPSITGRVVELTEDPKTTTAQLSDVISQDQVLVSKALKMVNSAYYGLPRKIASVTETVTILGLDTLRTLVIGASVYSTINQISKGNGFKQESLWRHSAASAAAARILSIKMGIEQKEHAFVAGLLHDIGKIIILSFMPEEYHNIIKNSEAADKSLHDMEKEVLHCTHADIGKIVAQKWSFPDILVDTIGNHHDPAYQGENYELVAVVHLSNAVSKMAGYGIGPREIISVNQDLLKKTGIEYDELCLVADEIKGKISIDFL